MDERSSERPLGVPWRHVFLAILVMLVAASGWVIYELHRGVGQGQVLVTSTHRMEVLADSMAKSMAITRKTAARQDSLQRAVKDGVGVVIKKLDELSARNRAFQRAQLRPIAQHVQTVEAKVDSLQTSIPRKKR